MEPKDSLTPTFAECLSQLQSVAAKANPKSEPVYLNRAITAKPFYVLLPAVC